MAAMTDHTPEPPLAFHVEHWKWRTRTMTDSLDLPTFLLRGHVDHEKAAAQGRRLLSNRPAPPPPTLPLTHTARQGKRKRRSSAAMETLRSLGFDAQEIRGLSMRETERLCRRGEHAGTWRTNRALRELDTIGK